MVIIFVYGDVWSANLMESVKDLNFRRPLRRISAIRISGDFEQVVWNKEQSIEKRN